VLREKRMWDARIVRLLVPAATLFSLASCASLEQTARGNPSSRRATPGQSSQDWRKGNRWEAVCMCVTRELDHLRGKSKDAVVQFLGEADESATFGEGESLYTTLVYPCVWECPLGRIQVLDIVVLLNGRGNVTQVKLHPGRGVLGLLPSPSTILPPRE